MSPLGLLVREYAVPGGDVLGREVGVRRLPNKRVRVRWFCGEEHTFDKATVKQALDCLKVLPSDVTLRVQSVNGRTVGVRVEDGRLCPAGAPASSVPFAAFKKALKAAL